MVTIELRATVCPTVLMDRIGPGTDLLMDTLRYESWLRYSKFRL